MLKIPRIHAIFFKFAEFGKVRNSLERLKRFQVLRISTHLPSQKRHRIATSCGVQQAF